MFGDAQSGDVDGSLLVRSFISHVASWFAKRKVNVRAAQAL